MTKSDLWMLPEFGTQPRLGGSKIAEMDDLEYRLDRYHGLARDLYAAWVSHRMGITLAHARRRYANEVDLGAYWMDLAQRVENDMLTHMATALDGPDDEPTTIVQ